MDEEEECDSSSAQRAGFTISYPESHTPEIETEALPPSPGTSTSSLHGSGVNDSPSSLPNTSTPSSIVEHIPQPENVASRHSPTLRQSASAPRKLPSLWSSPEPGFRPNLWQKFKANVKGSPSSNGLLSDQPYDSESHAKGRKNKGLLSRSSSIRS